SPLLGALPYRIGPRAGRGVRVCRSELVRRERDDGSLAIRPIEARERTPFKMDRDDLIGLTDRVRAVHPDRSRDDSLGLLRRTLRAVWELWQVRSDQHLSKAARRIEHVGPERIGTPRIELAAIRTHVDRFDQGPRADKLIFQRLLLGDGAA